MGKRTHGPYLLAAIEYNDIEKVSHILATKFRDKAKVKIFLTTEVRRLASEYVEVPLMLSATLSDPTIIRYFVTKHDVNVNFPYEYGAPGQRRRKTALLVAVRRGHYATVDALLSLNADANAADHKSRTALHHAVRRADYRMAKLLLARGAITSLCDASGNTALHVASIFGHLEMCRLLLRHSADVYKKGQLGALPIHMASREGHGALVKMFVTMYEVSADIRVPCYGDREQAPIHVAASQGHHETVFLLLEQCGADVNVRDSEGETPLHCSVINEYDPLGMKSKDDYTETAKILLNFGADVNLRNARGETPLHLAARNEFQKVLEVLLLAGCDPSIEDNDKNKAIDLVDENDTVSKQILKNALIDRDRLFNESQEIRAKGFSTSLQRELPLSMRSQSTMNVPLLAGMHSVAAANRYTSHTGLFQPNLSMQYPPTFGGGLSGGPMNHSIGYIPGAAGMAHYGGPVGTGSGGNHSGSRTGSSSNGSWGNVLQAGPRHLGGVMHGAASVAALSAHPPRGPAVTASPLRKVRSVEELDQPRRRNPGASKGSSSRKKRDRRSSYQESEASSFWAVTPPASIRHDDDDDDDQEQVQSPVSLPATKSAKPMPPAVASKKPVIQTRIYENEEETRNNSKQPPLKFVSAKKAAAAAAVETDDYYLDDDSSVDMLELDDEKPRKKKDKNKLTSSVITAQAPATPSKNEPVVKKKAVESWVDEQARIVKERQAALEAGKPVAHSTPPTSNKKTKTKDNKRRNTAESSDDDVSSESSTSSSESETSESDSDLSSNAPKGPPPPLPPTKPKPMPPPKPSSSSKGDLRKKSTSSNGPTTAPRKAAGGKQQPLFQMEEPAGDRIIQVDVDESTVTGETVISIIPLQPPGPTRVQKVPTGVETSTYLSLSRSNTPKLDESTTSKTKRPMPAPHDVKTSKHQQEVMYEGPRPVARPRESKKTEATGASAGNGERRASDRSTKKTPKKSRNDSASSTDFSDEDHEESAAQAAVSAKSKTGARSTPTIGVDRKSPFPKPQSAKPVVTQQKTPGGAFAAAKMIFQKASANDSLTDAEHRSNSLGDVTMSTTASMPQPAPQPRKLSDHDLTSSSSAASCRATSSAQLLLNTSTTSDRTVPVASSRANQPQQPLKSVQPSTTNQKPARAESSEEDSDSDDSSDDENKSNDFRTVQYHSVDQNLGFTLVGGNVKGVFVDAVDVTSVAALGGLRVGDQLLCVDGRPVFGRTREEVVQMIRMSMSAGGSQAPTSLLVRHRPNLMRTVPEGGGDSLNVRAHFVYDASRRGELTVNNGDVFAVSDTLPDGSAGFWRAKKVDQGGRKDGDFSAIGSGSSSPDGLVPNKSKADQIALRDLLAQGKSGQQRGTTFFRSFRRSKSVGRNGGSEDDETATSSADTVGYERVVNKVAEFHRPVVVLGLFCDTVRGMLISDASSKFVTPIGEVETKDPTSSELTVDVKAITAVPTNRHCVLIMTPPGIEYLQQHTDLNPIVIYISPVSKNVVKVVKAKLAPTYNKNPGFMYDEASRFEKNYAHLFSAVVPYTMNDEWYHNLRDAVDYLQKQPTWVTISPAELDVAAEAQAAIILPSRMMKQLATESAAAAEALRRGVGKAAGVRPVSRTTDDLPQEYTSQQKKSTGLVSETGQKVTADQTQQKSSNVILNGNSKLLDGDDGKGTMKSTSRLQAPAETSSLSQTTAKSAVSAKTRTQSSSSTLDQQRTKSAANTVSAISTITARSRVVTPSPSHETQL